MITYDINVLIGAADSTVKAFVKCNDSGVNLHVFLKTRRKLSDVRFEDVAYAIPDNSTAVLKINKVDNTFVLVDGPASSDSVFFEMPPQAFTAVGVHTAEVSIYGPDGRRITSADFFIETTSECISDTSAESETYIDILAEHIKTINDSAAASETFAEAAEGSAKSAKGSADAASASAKNASESAEGAAAAAKASADYYESVKAAKTDASQSATRAEGAATSASNSRSDSEAAARQAGEYCARAEEAAAKAEGAAKVESQNVSNALKGSASGEIVLLPDVSPIEHTVKVDVSRKNLFDCANAEHCGGLRASIVERTANSITVKQGGGWGRWQSVVFALPEDLVGKTVTISGVWSCSADNTGAIRVQWMKDYNGAVSGSMLAYCNKSGVASTGTITEKPSDALFLGLVIYSDTDSTLGVEGDTVTYSNVQLEIGYTATSFAPFVEDPAAAKVQVFGKNLANKDEFVDFPAVRKYLPLELKAGTYYYSSNMHTASGAVFYTGIVPDGEVSNANNIVMFSSFAHSTDEGVFTIPASGTYRFLIYCSDAEKKAALDNAWDNVWVQIEHGTAATSYEPYKDPVEYEQGEEIPSVSPVMTITTDTPGALVSVEYNKDINAVIEMLTKAIISLGGNV